MGEKKKVYHALVDGATAGLTDKALFDYVQEKCSKTSSKRIVRASLLALSDPDLKDRNVLNTIYALAIKHRLDDGAADDHDEDDAGAAPTIAAQAAADGKGKAGKSTGKARKRVAKTEDTKA